MIRIISCMAAVVLLLAPASASAQGDPFSGTWRLNVEKSKELWQAQPQPKAGAPQAQSFELVTMNIANGAMQYSVEYARGKERHKKGSYTAKFNDAKWQDVNDVGDEAISALTLVKSSDRIHSWVTRGKDGQFAGLVHRRLADDARSFVSVGVGTDGYVQYVRVFEKQ